MSMRSKFTGVDDKINYFVVECSAKTGKGLQDGMEWLVDQINKGE